MDQAAELPSRRVLYNDAHGGFGFSDRFMEKITDDHTSSREDPLIIRPSLISVAEIPLYFRRLECSREVEVEGRHGAETGSERILDPDLAASARLASFRTLVTSSFAPYRERP